MSNIKEVKLQGWLPFNCAESGPLVPFLSHMNGPSFGLKIEWREHQYVENEHGGRTAIYFFTISGQEAVRTGYLDGLVDALLSAGVRGLHGYAKDIENGGAIVWRLNATN